MKKLAILLSVVLSFVLSACAPTQTSRATGQVIDDAAITARVKTEIAQKLSVGDAAAINIDTYRGTVILAGFVDDQQKKEAAGQVAVGVDGVDKVFNNLQIKSRP